MTRRILITGHNGYLGSVLTPLLQASGYDVAGLDTGLFRDCTLTAESEQVTAIAKDIRDVQQADLKGYYAVIHLAALSNDPLGNLSRAWTYDINFRGAVRLAAMAKRAGVQRFLFSSSCIMYGTNVTGLAFEDSPVDPQTAYANSKVVAERAIADLAGDGFSPTFLRNGTVYGLSPRMRFDTVLNDFVGSVLTSGTVEVRGDGRMWRPVVHIEDVARAFRAVLEAPKERVHAQSFNVGASDLNCRIGDLAEIAAGLVPNGRVEYGARPTADHRTYKADFSKFARHFPDFVFEWRPATGARDLWTRLKAIDLARTDYLDRRFTRLKWLRYLIENQRLSSSLRWADWVCQAS